MSARVHCMTEITLRESLEDFLIDNRELEALEQRLRGFNIFEAIGHVKAEERHSDFLAFLLDPLAPHGLGDDFITRFLQKALKSLPADRRPIQLIDLSLIDLSRTLVIREHHQIDIFALDDANKIAMVIENKIASSEHSDQLRRYREFAERAYPEYRRVCVYLTPARDDPSDEYYVPFSYDDVADLIEEQLARRRDALAPPVETTLRHYLEMLRRHIVTDETLITLARSIYQKHQAALDFIFEQRPDQQLELSDAIAEMIRNTDGFVLDRHIKSYVNFAPQHWTDIPAFNTAELSDWTRSGRNLLFEFRNSTNSVGLKLVVGPCDSDFRQQIFDLCQQHPKIFSGGSKKLYRNYTTVLSNTILSKDSFERSDTEELIGLLKDFWRNFTANNLSEICNILEDRFAEGQQES